MPVDVYNRIKSKILPTYKFAFCFSVIFGFIAHFYRMTNWLPNWDSLVFRNDPQHMESLGRWFLPYASGISSSYELPWLNGILSILYISIAVIFICETFDVKGRLTAALIGAVTVTFPTVISTFTYCYVADAYSLAFLFSCIAVYLLTHKGLLATIPAVALLTLSLGIYQAYITVAIALLMCSLLIRLVSGESTCKVSLKSASKYLVCGALSLLLYYCINSAVMALMHVEASDYQNISGTFSFKEFDLISAIISAYYVFFKFFFDFDGGFNLYSAVNIAVYAALFIGYAALVVKSKRRIAACLLLSAYIVLIPLGCTALYLANSGLDYHNLMKMSYFIAYIYLLLLLERLDFKAVLPQAIKTWTVTALCLAVVFINTVTANVAYHKLQIAFYRSYGILVRISDRIESLDSPETLKRILVVGSLCDSKGYSVNFPPDITGTTDGLIIRHDDETVGQSVVASALNDYCDMSLEFVHGDEADALKGTETVINMPCWPSDGSVAALGDTVILKLGEEVR